MSEWLERLGILETEEQENLAPRVSNIPKQYNSQMEFMQSSPKQFKVELGYCLVEFALIFSSDIALHYLAIRKDDAGKIVEVNQVDIYYDQRIAQRTIENITDGIYLLSPVIVYAPAFFSKELRVAAISNFAMDALEKFARFRFF